MRLLVDAPHVATRDCEHCQKYVYDESTGLPQEYRGGLVERPLGAAPNCRTRIGCPKGTPENQKGLSERNQQARQHWLESRAVGFSPEERADPIVRRNAALFERFERLRKLQREKDQREQMIAVIGK